MCGSNFNETDFIFDREPLAIQDDLKDFDISYNLYFVVGCIFALAVQGFLLLLFNLMKYFILIYYNINGHSK